MNKPLSVPARRDLRQRMIEDMNARGFSAKTQHMSDLSSGPCHVVGGLAVPCLQP